MFRPRVMPCLLLKDKGLVKTVKFKDPNYLGDPINAVWIYNKNEADELIFLDITATKEKRTPPIELIHKISDESFMPVAVGGGIRDIDTISRLLQAGVEKAVINTFAAENPSFIAQASREFGSQSIVAAIDVKTNGKGNYEVFTHAGTKKTGLDPVAHARNMELHGAGEIFINSIDRDGTMQGYDLALIRKVTDAVTVPVIASGGAGSLQDIARAIREGHANAAAAGSLFVYHGKRRAVLINFPNRRELSTLFKTS
ncbi:MAG: imidazole glycerol phosphate synthase subunit HisF [Deltaproteobacteria bacterium RBG_13_52_11b]|nr:MAG: imidazole glycerol phosphate synthase subunit HisF [Deltaproteobacteria bacterium RBG_13_52_11b]